MKTLLVVLLALASFGPGAEEKLGAGVTIADPTPIPAILKAPQDYVGKIVRIDGVAAEVCEEMGCWLLVADSTKKDAAAIRLKVDHGGAIVFPMSARGKQVSAEGTFEATGAPAPDDYQLKATGALVK